MSYQTKLKEKDDLIEILESRAMEMMEKKDDLFFSRDHSGPSCSLSDSGSQKEVAGKYAEENKQLKAHIARLTGNRQCME